MSGRQRSVEQTGLVVAGLVLAVVGATAMGPASVHPLFNLPMPRYDQIGAPPRDPMPFPQRPMDPNLKPCDLRWVFQSAQYTALAIAALIVLTVLILWLIGRLRPKARPETITDTTAMVSAVQSSIKQAREILLRSRSERGTAAQAIVDAWATLEEGAKVVGKQRDPAQTPTEFTVALLQDVSGADDDCAELLALYHRARFGGRDVTDALTETEVARADTLFHNISVAIVRPS